MSRSWKAVLRREIRIPWWGTLLFALVAVGFVAFGTWSSRERRRAAWHDPARRQPSPLEHYETMQQVTPETLRVLQEADETLVELLEADDPAGAVSRNELACIHAVRGERAAAEELLRESLAAHRRWLGDEHAATRTVRRNLEAVQRRNKRGEHAAA